MIRHIVLFKLKSFENEADKISRIQEFKQALESLPEIIKEIKFLSVGVNVNPSEQYDISLLTEFESLEALHTYAVHPDHQAAGKIIREVLESRACVDSEI
jgi:hypothetical protein